MNEHFRNGIFALSILFLMILLTVFFYSKKEIKSNEFEELAEYQKQIDSLKLIKNNADRRKMLHAFNPNYISEYKGSLLGLSAIELDRVYSYRASGKWINSAEDFKRISGVSDAVFVKIKSLFKFPEWVEKSQKVQPKVRFKSKVIKEDLNEVTSIELQEKLEIPDFIADRIIGYREKIGKFVSDIQLTDIKGLFGYHREKILRHYQVSLHPNFKKIALNRASAKDLMSVPYFDFETVLEIRDLLDTSKGLYDFNELGKIKDFPMQKLDRIKLYLTLN